MILVCPAFKRAIAKGFGHLCFVYDNCLGLACNVPIPFGPKTESLRASVEAKPLELKIEVSIQGQNFTIQPDGKMFIFSMFNIILSDKVYNFYFPMKYSIVFVPPTKSLFM